MMGMTMTIERDKARAARTMRADAIPVILYIEIPRIFLTEIPASALSAASGSAAAFFAGSRGIER
jgi:hypothetical protein